jgi:hypothetical protein
MKLKKQPIYSNTYVGRSTGYCKSAFELPEPLARNK